LVPKPALHDAPLIEGEESSESLGAFDRYQKSQAIFRALTYSSRDHLLPRGFGAVFSKLRPSLGSFPDRLYDGVARNRPLFSWLSGFLFGDSFARSTFRFSDQLFVRSLFLVYLIAFASLWTQWRGLFGSVGVAPIESGLNSLSAAGVTLQQKVFEAPSIFWVLGGSDRVLNASLVLGMMVSGVGLLAPYRWLRSLIGVLMAGALLIYMSWVTHGQGFMQFQWDTLLLESGWLALCLSGAAVAAHWRSDGRWVSLAARVLLFKLIFLSGWVKGFGGDAAWSNHAALLYHFETQPLPTVAGVWFHFFPEPVLRFFSRGVVLLELALPFFFFLPRRMRVLGFLGNTLLQGLFALTGNFGFFNLLSFFLGFYLLDDRIWRDLLAFVTRKHLMLEVLPSAVERWQVRSGLVRGTALLLVFITALPLLLRTGMSSGELAKQVSEASERIHLSHAYGLFARMTQVRYELVFEGSLDRKEWREYQPLYRPGLLDRAPARVAPHQPRLDWQTWFAVLGQYGDPENRWVGNLLKRLLDSQPEVLALFRNTPFPDEPPRAIRASVYRYRLLSAEERARTGNWWTRDWLGQYSPELIAPARE
jgi:hypothetical protein